VVVSQTQIYSTNQSLLLVISRVEAEDRLNLMNITKGLLDASVATIN